MSSGRSRKPLCKIGCAICLNFWLVGLSGPVRKSQECDSTFDSLLTDGIEQKGCVDRSIQSSPHWVLRNKKISFNFCSNFFEEQRKLKQTISMKITNDILEMLLYWIKLFKKFVYMNIRFYLKRTTRIYHISIINWLKFSFRVTFLLKSVWRTIS